MPRRPNDEDAQHKKDTEWYSEEEALGVLCHQGGCILPQDVNKFYLLSVCYQGYGFSRLLPGMKRSGERSEWLGTPVIGSACLPQSGGRISVDKDNGVCQKRAPDDKEFMFSLMRNIHFTKEGGTS